MESSFLERDNNGATMFFQVGQCALRSPKIAAQKQENRCVLRDGATGVMVKGSLGTGSEGVEVDRWMHAFAWRRHAAKLLFRIVPPWIQNSQSKVIHSVRRHGLSSRYVRAGRE